MTASGNPSMGDIARRAGVSKNTVSLALRRDPQIPPPTRRRIERIARALGYRKNPLVSHLLAELRSVRPPGFRATLAILNANGDPAAFRRHPTIPAYVEGCRRRAAELGYGLDEFWLHDPALNGERLVRMLRARGIRGALVVGLMKENRLPERFGEVWRRFPAVATGVRTKGPTLSFAAADHHMLARLAFENALRLGYLRPALVLDAVIDRLVDGRFSAGVWSAQQTIPAGRRTRPFLSVTEGRECPVLFPRWLEKERPDAILTLYHTVRAWVEGFGLRVPRDLGLIQLERRRDGPDWAGMDQHNDAVGEAAVEMLVGMIHHGGPEGGPPPFPRATLIGGTWTDGKTVRRPPVPKTPEIAGRHPGRDG